MDKENAPRLLAALIISGGILFFWSTFFPAPTPVAPTAQTTVGNATPTPLPGAVSPPTQSPSETLSAADSVAPVESVQRPLQNQKWKAVWDTKMTGGLTLVELPAYKRELKSQDVLVLGGAPRTFYLEFTDPQLASLNSATFKLEQASQDSIILSQENSQFKVVRTFSMLDQTYAFQWSVSVQSKHQKLGDFGVMRVHLNHKLAPDKTSSVNLDEFAVHVNNAVKNQQYTIGTSTTEVVVPFNENDPKSLEEWRGKVDWMLLGDHFFVQALVPRGTYNPDAWVAPVNPVKDAVLNAALSYPVRFKATAPILFEGAGYFGPKSFSEIKAIPEISTLIQFGTTSVDFMSFRTLSIWILTYLNLIFQNVISNYGIAIILLTITVRIILLPLFFYQMKSMAKMAMIQPQLAALKEKFKDDKQRLNQETLQLMRTNQVNPLGGCFPLLLQMPVFIALWQALTSTADLFHAPFTLWLQDLSAKDPYYILPISVSAVTLIQQLITPMATMDKAQRWMMIILPLVLLLPISMNLPSGVNLYWLVSSLFGIGQQLIVKTRTTAQPVDSGKKVQPARV